MNIFTEVSPGSSAPLSPLSIPASVTGRLNVMEAMEGVSSQPPRAPNSSVGLAPNPIQILSANDLGEDTYGLPQDVVGASSEPVANLPSSMRPDIVACCKVNTAYALGGNNNASKATSLLSCMDDVYKLSLAQDTLRRTIIANKLALESSRGENTLQTALENVGDNVAADMSLARETLLALTSLVTKTERIRNVFDVKKLLGSDLTNPNAVFRAPLTDLRDFAITRLLYSPASYTQVSDTKLLYQLVSDATNVLKKCSFNLVEGFSDDDRSSTADSRATRFKVDAETYGNNTFSYVPALVTAKYFLNSLPGDTPSVGGNLAHTAFVGSLPSDAQSRVRFLVWFLTKELRISKGLGKFLSQDAAQVFGGIAPVGNPFDNIFGAVPVDIYTAPAGVATIAGLFNVATTAPSTSTGRATRILPFENSNIDLVSFARTSDGLNNVVSGESLFLSEYLTGSSTFFKNYRNLFTVRVQAAFSLIDRFLLAQQSFDPTSDKITTSGMLNVIQDKLESVVRGTIQLNTVSPVNLILMHMMLAAQTEPELRFELYKLLCLCYLYGTSEGDNTRFRTILLQELSSSPLAGEIEILTQDNLAAITARQLTKVLTIYQTTLRQEPNSQSGYSLQYDVQSTVLAQASFTDGSVQNILYAAQSNADPNIFAAIVSAAKEFFAACSSTDGFQYQLVPNSSVTRYTGLSSSGMMLILFEIMGGMIVELLGAGTATLDDDILRVSRGGDGGSYIVSVNPSRLNLIATSGLGNMVRDIRNAVLNEEYFIGNVLGFLRQISAGMETVSDPSDQELAALAYVNANGGSNAKVTYASIRTARNNYRILAAKLARNNPNNQRLLNFYLDADNPDISSTDYVKLRDFAHKRLLTTQNNDALKSILTVGIPRGLLAATTDTSKDIIVVRVHRINVRREDIAYKPLDFVFDMSLFPVRFRNVGDDFVSCVDISENGSVPVEINGVMDLVRVDPFYATRSALANACLKNISDSYLLRSYINMMTGLNVDDSGLKDINAVASTIKSGFQTMTTDGQALAQTTLKEIQPRIYDGFLQVFQTYYGDRDAQNLLLPLTRNVSDFIFASRLYDRVFNVVVAPSDFAVEPGEIGLSRQLRNNILQLQTGNSSSGIVIDQYFVEIITR